MGEWKVAAATFQTEITENLRKLRANDLHDRQCSDTVERIFLTETRRNGGAGSEIQIMTMRLPLQRVTEHATPTSTANGREQGFIVRSRANPQSVETYEQWLKKGDVIAAGDY